MLSEIQTQNHGHTRTRARSHPILKFCLHFFQTILRSYILIEFDESKILFKKVFRQYVTILVHDRIRRANVKRKYLFIIPYGTIKFIVGFSFFFLFFWFEDYIYTVNSIFKVIIFHFLWQPHEIGWIRFSKWR